MTRLTGADWRTASALILFLFSVYLFTSALRFQSIDEIAVYSVTRSFIGHGRFDTDILFWVQATLGSGSVVAQGVDGHTYAVKDILLSLLLAPPMLLARVLPISPVRASFIVPIVITAITGGLVFFTARLCNFSTLIALTTGFAFGLGSCAWPYSETLYTQPVAGFGLALALLGCVLSYQQGQFRHGLIGGIGMGIAGSSVTPTIALIPAHCLYLILLTSGKSLRQWEWKKAMVRVLPFLAGVAPFLLMQGIYNWVRFGNPLHTGHQETGGADFSFLYVLTGLFGQILSTPRGILWYVPFVVLFPVGVALAEKGHRHLLWLAGVQIVTLLLIYSSFAKWWGGVSWGPRFLVPVMPSIALMIAPVLERVLTACRTLWRVLVMVVLFISVITQAFGTLLDPLDYEHQIAETLETITPPPTILPSHPALFDVRSLPWPRLWATLQDQHWDTLWLFGGQFDGLAMGILLILIFSGIWLIWLTISRQESPISNWVLRGQGILSLVIVLFLLMRFPAVPLESPEFDEVVQLVQTESTQDDALVVLLPYDIGLWVSNFDSSVSDVGVVFEDPLSAETAAMLSRITWTHSRIWLISQGTEGGNPANGVEVWLAERGFVGTPQWHGGVRLVPYAFSNTIGPLVPQTRRFGDSGLLLCGYAYEVAGNAENRWINIRLCWQTDRTQEINYTVFVHVLAEDGTLVSQHDGWPGAGFYPTSIWQPDIPIGDRHYLALPLELAAGRYRLVVGLYDQTTGQRLSVTSNSDYVILSDIDIEIP